MKKLYLTCMCIMMVFVSVFAAGCKKNAPDAETNAGADDETSAESNENTLDTEDVFASWNQDAESLNALIDYIEAVTDEGSKDFIPEDRRIAVFDMDGTIYGELFPTYLEYYMYAYRVLADPSFTADEEMIAVGEEIRDSAIGKIEASKDLPVKHATQAARAYSGLTLDEFKEFVNSILIKDVDGFEGMTYGEAFYQPMIEVIDYLNENGFKVYLVSGSDRFICRDLLDGMVDIPEENIIGMDVQLEATGQNGTDGLDYVYSEDDEIIRTDKLLIKNLKMNKVSLIAQEIGKQPVLAFGNSSGDTSMFVYTTSDNEYRSAAFALIADDDVRDYGDPEKVEKLRKTWEEYGFNVISMRNDFKTIYGEDVKKTDTFRWEEELGGKAAE